MRTCLRALLLQKHFIFWHILSVWILLSLRLSACLFKRARSAPIGPFFSIRAAGLFLWIRAFHLRHGIFNVDINMNCHFKDDMPRVRFLCFCDMLTPRWSKKHHRRRWVFATLYNLLVTRKSISIKWTFVQGKGRRDNVVAMCCGAPVKNEIEAQQILPSSALIIRTSLVSLSD